MPASERARHVLYLTMSGQGVYIEQTTLTDGTPVEVICRRFELGPDNVEVYPMAIIVDDRTMPLLNLPSEGWEFVPNGSA